MKTPSLEEVLDAFKSELEVGRWYKREEELLVWNNGKNTYGFNEDGFFSSDLLCSVILNPILATEQEVSEALIAEAKKRGIEKGSNVGNFNGIKSEFIHSNSFKLNGNLFFMGGTCVLMNGKWAKPNKIRKISQSELIDFYCKEKQIEKTNLIIE